MNYTLVLSIILLTLLAGCSNNAVTIPPPGDGNTVPETFTGWLSIDTALSTLEFEGSAVGKSHLGTFDAWSGELQFQEGTIIGAKGIIQATSVSTGIGGLDNHLKSDDFFDTENYPEIIITSTGLEDGIMTADLTFRGITKAITFPVTRTRNSLSADFILDTRDFAMKYIAVSKDVRIAFTMTV